jgi:hypothetical protein
MREYDWLVGDENTTPRMRPMEAVWIVIALGLVLILMGAGEELKSAEITAKHVAEMPSAHPCEVTIAQYGAVEKWARLKHSEQCALWAKEPPPWIMSMPIIAGKR